MPTKGNPFYADKIVLKDGGVIERQDGTDVVAISADGQTTTFTGTENITAGEITLAEGSLLIGNSSGVATALDASTSGQVPIGNGTTAVMGLISEANVANPAGAGLYIRKHALVIYDFSVDGGAQGAITLSANAAIPDNAVIVCDGYDVLTTCTSSTDAATIKLNLVTDGDLTTALAISNGANPWDAGAFSAIEGNGAFATPPTTVKTTGTRAVQVTIATEDLTAGKIIFHLSYYVTE